jgi:hypothetical protein
MEAIVIGMLCPFRLLGNDSFQRKALSILYNTKAFESQPGFNRRNLGVIAPEHFVDSSFGHIAERPGNDLPQLNVRIEGVEVESGRRITLIDLNPTAPLLFIPPVNELGI